MSVMCCGKVNCDSIMCDIYIEGFDYVCSSCYELLLKEKPRDIQKWLDTPLNNPLEDLSDDGYEDYIKSITTRDND